MKYHLTLIRFVIVIAMIAFGSLCGKSVALAKVQTVEADGYYIIGDGPDENHSVAKDRARMDAKRQATEKAGVFVESVSEVRNNQLVRDEINTIAAQVLKIQSEKITAEVVNDTVIRYRCHIVALVDSANVTAKLVQDRQKLYEAMEQNKRLLQELDAIKEEMTKLKAKYMTSDENTRQEINREIKQNEEKFTAANWFDKGIDYFDQNNYQKAIECYKKAIELNPKYAYAWNGLGVAYGNLGNHKKEIEYCQKAIELNPKLSLAWNNLGVAYDKLGNTQKGIEYYQKAIALSPDFAAAWTNLGGVFFTQGYYQKAKEHFQRAIELNPKFAVGWYSIGLIYYQQENYQKAKEYFQKAVELNLKFTDAWNNLGLAYGKLGNPKKEIECYNKAIKLEPKLAEAWNNLGAFYGKLGKWKKAVEFYGRAFELAPGNKYIKYNYEFARKKLAHR